MEIVEWLKAIVEKLIKFLATARSLLATMNKSDKPDNKHLGYENDKCGTARFGLINRKAARLAELQAHRSNHNTK